MFENNDPRWKYIWTEGVETIYQILQNVHQIEWRVLQSGRREYKVDHYVGFFNGVPVRYQDYAKISEEPHIYNRIRKDLIIALRAKRDSLQSLDSFDDFTIINVLKCKSWEHFECEKERLDKTFSGKKG